MFSTLKLKYYKGNQEPHGISLKTYYRGRTSLNLFYLIQRTAPNITSIDVGALRDSFIPRPLQGINDYIEHYDNKVPFNLSNVANFPAYFVFHTLLTVYDKEKFRVLDEHYMNARGMLLCEMLTLGNAHKWLTNIE